MFEKLQADYQRFKELDAALLDPALASDPGRYAGLAKERGAINLGQGFPDQPGPESAE